MKEQRNNTQVHSVLKSSDAIAKLPPLKTNNNNDHNYKNNI